MKSKNGQILFMFLFSVLVIFTFFTLITNVSKLSVAKMQLQKAADAAALAMSTYQARAFNAISDKNYILKYPSGDETNVYKAGDKTGFSMPGVDKAGVDNGFEFISESDFEGYLKMLTPHQAQQDSYVRIYQKLIPKLAEDYSAKNDDNAKVIDAPFTLFAFKREKIKVRVRDWINSTGGQYNYRENIDAWMTHPTTYSYSLVKLHKAINLWNISFDLEAVALGEVVMQSSQIWPDPKPAYKSKLGITQEKGVLH